MGGPKEIDLCYNKISYKQNGKEAMRMEKTKRYNIEGASLIIPLQYDKQSGKYMEMYPDFIKNPVYTPKGYPIMLTVEDACVLGEQRNQNEPLIDCGSCRFYKQLPNTLIGVCRHDKRRYEKQKPNDIEDKEVTQ